MPQAQFPADPRRGASRLGFTSTAFRHGDWIPPRHTGDGQDLSPPLAWTDPPYGTRSLAMVCEDPDAPTGVFSHWLVWDIPSDARELKEGVPRAVEAWGLRQGANGFSRIGYAGPKPPPGKPHRYRFWLYALDEHLRLPRGATRAELDRALDGHVLSEGVLVGIYGR
jgi:Raf kinase inhibitor-like YbhB/YbcL family protein